MDLDIAINDSTTTLQSADTSPQTFNASVLAEMHDILKCFDPAKVPAKVYVDAIFLNHIRKDYAQHNYLDAGASLGQLGGLPLVESDLLPSNSWCVVNRLGEVLGMGHGPE